MSKEAMKQAMTAFSVIAIADNLDWIRHQAEQQATALREVLAAFVQQEPVACVQDLDEVKRKHLVYEKGMDWKDPLYTSPQPAQRPWIGLTELG